MEENSKNNNTLILIIAVVALVASICGGLIGASVIQNNNKNNNTNTNNPVNNNKEEEEEENKEEEIPKQSNSFYDNMLKAYKYVPSDFEIDNISNKFLAQFVLNTYVFNLLKVNDYTNINDANYDLKATVTKKDVDILIKNYFYMDNVNLENFENTDWYKLENKGDNYIIYTKSTEYNIPDLKINNVEYNGNEILVKYTLYSSDYPYDEIGNVVYKLKYENGNYKVVSKNTTRN